jgi:selenocysteine lyase/cysteine desulfurase
MPKRLHLASVKGALEEERVSASLRGTALRISPHLYNDEEDMAALLRALRRAVGG